MIAPYKLHIEQEIWVWENQIWD